MNPVSNDTGSFDIKYNNTDGKWASLQGNMKNGTITDLKQQTQVQQEKLLEKLKQNTLFQQFHNQLVTEGFSQNDIKFEENENENKTNIILQYENQKNDTAKITANFMNDEITQVTLEDDSSNSSNLFWLVILVIVIVSAIFAYFIIKKYLKKKTFTINDSPPISKLESFEPIKESKKLISRAQRHHEKGEYKEAFGTAGKAIRLFLSYDAGLQREVTSEELLRLIPKNNNYPIKDIRDSLKITDLVEFAKYSADENDFKKIISLFNELSNKQNVDKS